MAMIRKVPYGQSNYETLIKHDFVYVDKTKYIETLEKLSESFLFFLRPRRFGKSLFVSMLQYYYGKEHKEKFASLFGGTYIGKNPTPFAGGYYVIVMDFSKINTDSKDNTYIGFNEQIEAGLLNCNTAYSFFSMDQFRALMLEKSPSARLTGFLNNVRIKNPDAKFYILIDEYDHFANEIIAFNFEHFAEIVSRNGYVRKFYEALKAATREGIVERMFVTGVTPITLDSLTSGFNIGRNISLKLKFNEMMGFTENEVRYVLREACGEGKFNEDELIVKMAAYYNGSLFSPQASSRLYNSDMVLYFVSDFIDGNYTLPKNLLDKNVSSDYSKIRRMMALKNPEQNREILRHIIFTGEIDSDITEQYNFERDFSDEDFISLLFYNGLLTIHSEREGKLRLQIPNYVIKRLYWSFFLDMLREQEKYNLRIISLREALSQLAFHNNIKPLMVMLEEFLSILSNRDAIRFDEKYIKMLFVSYADLANLYLIQSEREANKGYIDLLFLFNESVETKYQFMFEFKYLPKGRESELETVKQQAAEQLKQYHEDPFVKQLKSLKSYVIVFVGAKAFYREQLAVSS